jgi:phage gp36-like protein
VYASVSDMTARFGETQILRLSNPEDRVTEVIDNVRVDRHLADATEVINGYIRGRYAVPLVSPPADIVRATCIIALHDLAQGERTSPTEEMEKNYKSIITWLEQIAKELINIDAPAAVSANPNPGSGARMSDRQPVFTHDSLRGM